MRKKHSRSLWILLGLGIIAVVGLVVVLVVFSGDGGDGEEGLRRSRVARGELGYEVEATRLPQTGDEPEIEEVDGKVKRPSGKGGKRVRTKSNATTNSKSNGEVDLGNRDQGPVELTPDDVLNKYKSNGFAINRCYERALKRDPFLEIRRASVTVSVDSNGRASASIPGIKNAVLRKCLESTIRSWRFKKPKEPLRATLTMIFKAR